MFEWKGVKYLKTPCSLAMARRRVRIAQPPDTARERAAAPRVDRSYALGAIRTGLKPDRE